MLVGVSQKRDFGWHIGVIKFPNLESAEKWLYKEQFDFRDRLLFDYEFSESYINRMMSK